MMSGVSNDQVADSLLENSRQGSRSLGPIGLADGVSRTNVAVFLYAAFIGICLNTFINFIQPYVLVENLNIPENEQGRLSGDLVFYGELVLLLVSTVAGSIADRIGRRLMFTIGLLILTLGYIAYGLINNETELVLLRLLFAVGVAIINVMVSTLQADYSQPKTLGKLVAMTGVCIGLGSLFIVFVLSRLPAWYGDFGVDASSIPLYTLLTVAAIALISVVIIGVGLKPESAISQQGEQVSLWQRFYDSLVIVKHRPALALAYGSAFVARGDLIVVGVFYSLWITQTAIASGLSSMDAVKTAGIFFGVVQGTALLWAPVAGWVNDKINRVDALRIALLLAAAGYGSMAFFTDPTVNMMYPAAMLLGIGQMSVMSASQTLVGQEAPAEIRGSIIGTFSFFGGLGILFVTKLGGQLFDVWKPAPFVLVATVNIVLLLASAKLSTNKKSELTEVVDNN